MNKRVKHSAGTFLAAFCLLINSQVSGQVLEEKASTTEALRRGMNFIPTPVYSEAEDQRLLELFKGLRVADVADGMDAVGLQNIGLMDPDIHPLWRDTTRFTHRFVGIAVTARYVPTQKPPAGSRSTEDYDRWAGDWYERLSGEPVYTADTQRNRPGDRRCARGRRWLHWLLQHTRMEKAGLRGSGDRCHRQGYRRNNRRACPPLFQEAGARHKARSERAGIGE